MNKKALQLGINLGGWISQYPSFDHQHFKTFITAEDIKRIAEWGMDHVRLPVDYPVLEDTRSSPVDDSQPGNYRDSGFEYIEACLTPVQANGLSVILDLHKAPGFAFDVFDKASLFDNPGIQDRFLDLWTAIATRFAGRMEDMLAFELLNEIVLPDSGPWNQLVKKAVERIRALDSERLILVGSNFFNSADELQNLDILDDPNILYTFHFYLPMTITHQRATWVPPLFEYNRQLEYPGQEASGLEAIVEKYPGMRFEQEVGIRFDKEYLRAALQPALDFSRRIGQPVYCGEFGVYERASMSTRLNWTRDVVELLDEFQIGRAYWTYKNLDFGLLDKNGQVVNQELLETVSKRYDHVRG
jgi:aryl-phospho-beta-D-glucosidase BglC (GH1 family)